MIISLLGIGALGCASNAPSEDSKSRMFQLMRRMGEARRARSAPLKLDRDYSAEVQPLIQELRNLPPELTFDAFYCRRAMSKLAGMGRRAFPTLKETFLRDEDWTLKLSAGYLVFLMDGLEDSEVVTRFSALATDSHPAVRSMALSILEFRPTGQMCGSPGLQMPPEETAIANRLSPIYPWITWMSDVDVLARAAESFTIIQRGQPYLEPAIWKSGIQILEDRFESPMHAPDRLLTRDQDMAERFLHQVFRCFCPDKIRPQVLDRLEADDGSQPERLGRWFSLAGAALSHPDLGTDCRQFMQDFSSRLLACCLRWAWKTSDVMALSVIVSMLASGPEEARTTLADMKDRHPNLEVRYLAERRLQEARERALR